MFFNQLYFEESMICVNYLYKLGLVIKNMIILGFLFMKNKRVKALNKFGVGALNG
jgi:hypothetical protein